MAPASSKSPTSPIFWKGRLIYRNYLGADELFAYISHLGENHFVPLGTKDETQAAQQAAQNYKIIAESGWPAFLQKNRREFILAICWNQNPAIATYSTFLSKTTEPSTAGKGTFDVIFVEPDPTLGNALAEWINSINGWRCAGVFPEMQSAIKKTQDKKPALALCNCGPYKVPENYPARLKAIQRHMPAVPYAIHPDSNALFLNIFNVSRGYIFKRTLSQDMLAPLQGVESNPELWSDAIRRYYASLWDSEKPCSSLAQQCKITAREAQILQGISEGLLNKEIAERFKISPHTVHNHLRNIFQKIGVENRTEAARWYLQQ